MANCSLSHDGVPENLRKQLAVAVRSIQWSYAIFWSLSTTQQGVLEWGDGYYNGDIKTRKTVQAMELKADKIGLQRSEQLRELYESLLVSETDPQAKRPSVALSPEDLSDAEWYYLVCMSFTFSPGEGLPGRALANGQTIWLCDAQYADSKIFSRSLLAKSASIQTVVCFPYLGGVIELGVTELVSEDPSLLQHFKTSLLELSKPVCSDISSSAPHKADEDKDPMCLQVNHEIANTLPLENLYTSGEDIKFDQGGISELGGGDIHEEFKMDSPDECSHGCEHNCQTEDSFMLEGVQGGASQVQSWHFMDDDFSNGVQYSLNSSDCISEAFVNQEKATSVPRGGNVNSIHLQDLQNSNHTKLGSLDLDADDDLYYKRTLSAVLRNSPRLIENTCLHYNDSKSSFLSWKRVAIKDAYRPQVQQRMLKKILFKVPKMHGSCSFRSQKENGGKDWVQKLKSDDSCIGHFLPDKQKENENFLVLRSLVPCISEIDKASILSDTIRYMKELEARVEELESCMDSEDFEVRGRTKYMELVEQISDNYDKKKIHSGRKSWINKRKASDIDETDPDLHRGFPEDGRALDVKVSIKDQEVLIEMRCPYREYILLDVMDAINNLHLDAHSVQSSAQSGILQLTLKSKFRGAAIAPVGMIKQALWNIACKC